MATVDVFVVTFWTRICPSCQLLRFGKLRTCLKVNLADPWKMPAQKSRWEAGDAGT